MRLLKSQLYEMELEKRRAEQAKIEAGKKSVAYSLKFRAADRTLSDDDIDRSERELKQMEAIIFSMTPAERQNPQILNASRRRRISAGCGQPVSKINNLIKRYEDAKKMMKQLSSPSFMKKNKRFKGLF